MKITLFAVLLIYSLGLLAQEKSESFIVYAYDKSYKVVAPEVYSVGVAAVLENKTLIQLRGKFQKRDGTLIKHVAISPQSSISVDLQLQEGEMAYFVPYVPAFQEVELRFGQRAYEIPATKTTTLR
jgi:hypothetical protein